MCAVRRSKILNVIHLTEECENHEFKVLEIESNITMKLSTKMID